MVVNLAFLDIGMNLVCYLAHPKIEPNSISWKCGDNYMSGDENKQLTGNDASKVGEAGSSSESKLSDITRSEVSAQAVARMMGVATTTEVKLLEGKLDLISSRISNMTVRLEKVISQFNQLPSGSDLERIDVQIGSLKTMIRDVLSGKLTNQNSALDTKFKDKKPNTTVVTADTDGDKQLAAEKDEAEEDGQEVRS